MLSSRQIGVLELRLQRLVVPEIVLRQRLLDQQQVQIIQRQQGRGVFQGVGRVGVDLQAEVREGAADRLCVAHIPAGLDLDLDAPVALRQVALDTLTSASGEAWMPTDTPTSTLSRCAAQQLAQRAALALALQIPQRHLQAGFGHRVAAHRRQRRWKSGGPATSWPKMAGQEKSRRICQAVPDVS